MLIPAILKKDEIIKECMKYQYTSDMFYMSGHINNWSPNISDVPDGYTYQWAIVDSKSNLIGYFSYYIDFYVGSMDRFGLFSFDKGNPLIGKSVFDEIERCIKEYNLHRVEWRMVGGNPAERGYDKFLKKHNGTKHVLIDAIKDKQGNYHDDIIYEIIIKENK